MDFKFYYLFVSSLALALGLSACNTMEGVGKDLQSGGKNIEKAASDNHKS